MANNVYEALILENKFKSILEAQVALNPFITVEAMAEGAGDTKRVISSSVTGEVEDLAMGEGNTETIETVYNYQDFKLGTTQGHFAYYDEEFQKNASVVDTGLKGMAEKMTNNFNQKIAAQYGMATKKEVAGTISFDGFVDAVAKFGDYSLQLFALMNSATAATLKKSLKETLQYSSDFARTGYIGNVNGIPVYISDYIPAGEVYIANAEAVKCFMNKQMESEQLRNPDTRKNEIWMRTVACIALADEDKVCRLAAAATTTTTITAATKATKIVAGAATTGAEVRVYVNGNLKVTGTAAESAYSLTLADNLVTGDAVTVIARKAGQVSSIAKTTVA